MAIDLYELLGDMPEEAYAKFRDVQVAALRNERAHGKGPPYTKVGRKIYYSVEGIRKYHAAHTVTPGASKSTLIDGVRRRSRRHSGPKA